MMLLRLFMNICPNIDGSTMRKQYRPPRPFKRHHYWCRTILASNDKIMKCVEEGMRELLYFHKILILFCQPPHQFCKMTPTRMLRRIKLLCIIFIFPLFSCIFFTCSGVYYKSSWHFHICRRLFGVVRVCWRAWVPHKSRNWHWPECLCIAY